MIVVASRSNFQSFLTDEVQFANLQLLEEFAVVDVPGEGVG
jgi:hypothetical protein